MNTERTSDQQKPEHAEARKVSVSIRRLEKLETTVARPIGNQG